MTIQRLVPLTAFGIALLAGGQEVAARDSHTGVINVYNLQAGIPGIPPDRGACVATNPLIPGASPWACLYKNNALYEEFNDLLRTAYMQRKTCTLGWARLDVNNHKLLDFIDCR